MSRGACASTAGHFPWIFNAAERPRMMIVVLTLLLILELVQGERDFTVFVVDPQSNISPLGSSASFSCSVVAEAVEELLWEVNGGQTSSESYGKTLREKGMEWRYFENDQESNLELTILASEENDETTVVCVAFTLNHGILKTPQVTLSVYGQPSAPVILTLTPMVPGEVSLTWSQPYSPSSVTVSYTVAIREVNPENGAQVGEPKFVMVNNTTSFTFTPTILSCNEYAFTVRAENMAGESEESKAMSTTLPVAPNLTALSSSLSHSLAVNGDGAITCNITFMAAKACPDYPVILYNVHLHNTLTNTTSSHPLLPTLSSMGLMLQLDSSDGLERDAHYVYYVTAEGGAGIGESYKREMVTTDVSHVTLSLDCPTLNISCHLLPGSLARGCVISFSCLCPGTQGGDKGLHTVFNETIHRLNSSVEASATLFLTQQSCCHKLEVYDWEADGSIGHTPIPLRTNSTLCYLPGVVAGDNTTSSDKGASWLYLWPIIASVVGGFVLLAGMLLLVGLGVYCHHKTRTVLAKECNEDLSPASQQPTQEPQLRFSDPPTTQPPPPPLYDEPSSLLSNNNLEGNGFEARYSTLTKESFLSHTPLNTTDVAEERLYSRLNHFTQHERIDAVNPLPNHPVTTPPLPPLLATNHTYCELQSMISAGKDHEFINSLPSAGTTL